MDTVFKTEQHTSPPPNLSNLSLALDMMRAEISFSEKFFCLPLLPWWRNSQSPREKHPETGRRNLVQGKTKEGKKNPAVQLQCLKVKSPGSPLIESELY